jgi:hypothetical protein
VAFRQSSVLVVSALLLTAPALAEPPPLELTWNAPAGCPSGVDVRRQFERLAKVDAGHAPPRLTAEATVEQNGEQWHLRLHIVRDGAVGEREVDAVSCVSLARAAALELALAAGGSFVPDAEPPPEAAAPVPTTPPKAPDTSAEADRSASTMLTPTSGRSVTWFAALDGRYASGPLPGGAMGTAAGVDARFRSWMASARVVGWPHVREEPVAGVHATFAGVGGSLSACFVGSMSDDLSLAGCAGFQVSALRGSSTGGSESGSAVASWYAALPGVRARWRLVGALYMDVGVDGAISLTRPKFVITRLETPAHVVPLFAPSLGVGLAMRI